SAISGLSVLTTTLSNSKLPRAASIVYAIKGLPDMLFTFFFAMRFDPARAGIIASSALMEASGVLMPDSLAKPSRLDNRCGRMTTSSFGQSGRPYAAVGRFCGATLNTLGQWALAG